MRVAIVPLLLVLAGPSVGAPLPPPPPGAVERANAILNPPIADGLPAYGSLFADDVKVFDNNHLVASSRQEWLAYLRPQLSLRVIPHRVSYGNPIMVAETVSSMPEHVTPGVVIDCCGWARIVLYHLGEDGRVKDVSFFENGTYWGPPESPD